MNKIKHILSQEDTVLFIGSGLSLWSGLPSWAQLIEELAQFIEISGESSELVRAEAQRGDLLQAASYGFDKLTKQQIGDFIRKSCKYGYAKPHEIHKKIVSLGTRCFITTNYDNLLEEALRKWQPERFFRPPITNRQLTETAEIVHARAIDFIFKPHGDAGDSDSIILTREQYRQLLPQGERQNALESLKMILASRPVVYIGFGLRDPDFIYVRDLLANTYKGGIRDHYAIMADISTSESDYWRRNYGVHLIGYPTIIDENGHRAHTPLLALLDSFQHPSHNITEEKEIFANTPDPDIVLSLARHAARIGNHAKANPELVIRVKAEKDIQHNSLSYKQDKFNYFTIEKLLDKGPEKLVLVGLPGAGKSYALKQATARLAESLNKICLSDSFDEEKAVVPIFADLKLYQGNLTDLINQNLPKSLPLDQLIPKFNLKIFLDSFNEMPREYWENGAYESDFSSFEKSIGNSSIVISSRTSDGLDKLAFPIYHLDSIETHILNNELEKLNIKINGRFKNDVKELLQKPFYFHLVSSGAVSIPEQAHPKDFYQSLFENLQNSFEARFHSTFKLERALSIIAYDSINTGKEAYPLSGAENVLKAELSATANIDIDAVDILNWLVSKSILIPYSGARVAFVHQSITEYLAACELARQYQIDSKILRRKLALTRWDQAIFLTLSLLPQAHVQNFFKDIVDIDFLLALNAAKYIEFGRDELVSDLLKSIPTAAFNDSIEHSIGWHLESNLPVSEAHETDLRMLMKRGGSIAGSAVIRLAKIKGIQLKPELFELLVEHTSDYNYCCNGIARALKPFIINSDIENIAQLTDKIGEKIAKKTDTDAGEIDGFISGVAHILREIEIPVIRKAFLPSSEIAPISIIRRRIMSNSLWQNNSIDALEFAGELLNRGISEAATSIYFIASHSKAKDSMSWDFFTVNHIIRLISFAENSETQDWALKALECICSKRSDLAQSTRDIASFRSLIPKAVLMYCGQTKDTLHIFNALNELLTANENSCEWKSIYMLDQLDIDWSGQEELFTRILRHGNPELTLIILNHIHRSIDLNMENIEIGNVTWWLDWISSQENLKPNESYFLKERLSWFFARFTSTETQQSFVNEFSRPDSKYRKLLADFVLMHQSNLSSDDLNHNAIEFLIKDLENNNKLSFHGHLLSKISSENLILNTILPLLSNDKSIFQNNLREVVKTSGTRHGRRYISK